MRATRTKKRAKIFNPEEDRISISKIRLDSNIKLNQTGGDGLGTSLHFEARNTGTGAYELKLAFTNGDNYVTIDLDRYFDPDSIPENTAVSLRAVSRNPEGMVEEAIEDYLASICSVTLSISEDSLNIEVAFGNEDIFAAKVPVKFSKGKTDFGRLNPLLVRPRGRPR